MPMGIVTPEDFDSELGNCNKPISNSRSEREKSKSSVVNIIDVPTRGRGEGNVEVPDALRKIIGEESQLHGRDAGLAMARTFGISPSSVSAYSNGAHSTATYDETPNKNHIDLGKARVVKRARAKMMLALSHLTAEKIQESKGRDIAGIAKDMAVVIKTMEPEQQKTENNNRPQFVFFAPNIHNEEHYETIYAKE